MAHIDRRGDRWQARVRRRGYAAQSATFRTKAAAERWARDIEAKADEGRHAPPPGAQRMTLSEALDKYEREITPGKRGAQREKQRITVWKKQAIAARRLAHVRASDMAQHRRERLAAGYSPNTVRLELAVISHLFTIARCEWDMIGLQNPLEDMMKPSTIGTARDRRLEAGEETKLLEACAKGPDWLAPVVTLAIETAMRRGEIAGLRDEMIVGPIARLPMTKNGERRNVPLSPEAQAAVEAIRRACGGRLNLPRADGISHHFADAVKAAGLAGLHFHDLRHEATSRLFEKGLSVAEVAAITGHKTWSMLARYTHPRATDLAEKLAKKRPAPKGEPKSSISGDTGPQAGRASVSATRP